MESPWSWPPTIARSSGATGWWFGLIIKIATKLYVQLIIINDIRFDLMGMLVYMIIYIV
jgi:hypothetical protein